MVEALKDTFLRVDELLRKYNEDRRYNSGCTANVSLIHKDTLYVANAGDSRTILCNNN